MYPSAVSALFVDERDRDAPGVAIPCAEVHLAVRFGPATARGLDVHAVGGRQRVGRKLLRRGQRLAMARLPRGAAEAVFGVPASALLGRVVPLEQLWSAAETRRLYDRLGDVHDTSAAGAILESVIAGRLALAGDPSVHAQLALAAADRLASASVRSVADDLGVSERHLRRVFHETVGVNPKEFARLARFRRAIGAACAQESIGCRASWAGVAADAGYYDQAHLIAEFHALAGATPRALLDELRAAPRIGW